MNNVSMGGTLSGFYDDRLVALSVFIAIVASYAAFNLAGRVAPSRGIARILWLAGGSIAMGTGIWAMHYIGMEALQLPVPVAYDWPTVLLSLCAAILASGVALFIAGRATMSRVSVTLGSLFMGGGIAAMHYIGMDAMRLPAMCVYSPSLVALSVVLAVLISYIALRLTFAFRTTRRFWDWRKAVGGLVMGVAIPVMHYVGMAAVHFTPRQTIHGSMIHAVAVSNLGLASIALVTLTLLTFVFGAASLDQQLAAQALYFAESNLQLQTVFDHMKEAIVVVDSERNIIHKNRAAKRLLGLPDGLVTRKQIAESYTLALGDGTPLPPDSWPTVMALQGIFVENREFILHRKDTGQNTTAEISTVPIPSSTGEIEKIILSYRDVGERKQMDEAKNRLASIIEFSEDAIIGKTAMGIVTSWNRGAEKLFGYAASEMIGQSVKRLLPEGREYEEDDILARIHKGETVDHIESIRRKKDGMLIHVSLTISPIRDSWGNIIGASKIARDITEKKQLERQLRQAQKMEAIGQLTGGIAHDFNNLLGVVIGNLDLLETLVSGNEAALKRVYTAQKGALRGADLTRRLLTFSSSEELRPAPVKLQHTIRNMIELAGRAIGPEIKISAHFNEAIPTIFVDPVGLESALLNLVVNARDAMPKGGSISITTEFSDLEESYPPVQTGELKAGRYACVSVSDTGDGMSKETIERAFEPFFTTKPRGKGTGLGLAMVYGFVRQSGGIVRIYSELGYGTTVSLYLPLTLVPAAPSPRSPLSQFLPAAEGRIVLVVDDEPDLLEIASVYLAEMGYTALQAIDAAAALEIIAQDKHIDLMVTDIIMPGGMNGVELAQKARSLHPALKIIYSSGFPADTLAERSGTQVNGPLLQKPYQRADFIARVRQAMERGDAGL